MDEDVVASRRFRQPRAPAPFGREPAGRDEARSPAKPMPDALHPWGEPPERRDRRERAAARERRAPRWKARLWTAAIPILLMGYVVADMARDLSQPTGFSYLRDLYLAPNLEAHLRRDPRDGHTTLAVRGTIGAAAGPWLYDQIKAHDLRPGDTILLSSPGGNLDAALALGRTIRAHGLATAVGRFAAKGTIAPSFCASACVFAFAGGVVRRDIAGSRLGVHRFKLVGGGLADTATATQETMGRILAFLADMGVKPSLAEAAMASDDIRWLDPQEARAMDLVSSAGLAI